MKRLLTTLLLSGVVLTGCGGNPFGLDEEKVQRGVVDRALSVANVKEGGYQEEDIEVVQICGVVQSGKEEFGHQGYYSVSWQTKDGDHQYTHRMNENDYEVGGSLSMYKLDEEIGCYDLQ
jgi:hypothetical protein